MANIKSAAKQARMSVRRRAHNKERVSKFRSLEKQIRALVAKNDKDGAKKLLAQFQSALDKAAKARTLHHNTASRKKSRVTKLLK